MPLTGGLLPFRMAAVLDLNASGGGQPYIIDVSGDGIPDVIVPFALSSTMHVLVNTGVLAGAPTFTTVAVSLPANPVALAVADLNGDGRADVAIALLTGLDVCYQVTEGTLDDNFVSIATGQSPGALTAGDALGIGSPQVICPDAAGGAVQVFARDPVAVLKSLASYDVVSNGAIATESPTLVILADATGDGKLDLVLLFPTALGGASSEGAFGIIAGPLTPSSRLGAVFASAFPGVSVGSALDVGDLDGDGVPDVVLTSRDGGLTVYTGTGSGTFTTRTVASLLAQAVRIVDLDGDGHPDLLVAQNGEIEVYWNGGPPIGTPGFLGYGNFSATSAVVSTLDDASDLAVAALDPGGLPCVVATQGHDGLGWVIFQTSARSFTDMPLTVGGGASQVAIGDLDGDGLPDIAMTWGVDAILAIYYQNPKKTGLSDTFLPPVTLTTLGSPNGCVIVDVTGNGRNDVVVSSQTTNTLNVFIQR